MPTPLLVVGKSGCGKTTLIERLLRALAGRGLRAVVIKHHGHGESVDRPHKDTARVRAAGAETAVLASAVEVASFRTVTTAPRLADLIAEHAAAADLVLCEGYHLEAGVKVEVWRRAVAATPLCLGDPGLRALVTDDEVAAPVPRFGLDDVAGLVALLEDLGVVPRAGERRERRPGAASPRGVRPPQP